MEKEKKISKYAGSQMYVVWTSFKKSKLAYISLWFVIVIYLIALCAEFFAPIDARSRTGEHAYMRPTTIHVVDEEGNWHAPFVYKYSQVTNMETLAKETVVDTSVRYTVRFL